MSNRTRVRLFVVFLITAMLAAPAASIQAKGQVAANPAVIAEWGDIAMRTAITQGPVAQLYLGFVSAAMYNAVVTIEGRFEPYTEQPRAQKHASPEAAAATAAFKVLIAFFPDSTTQLTVDWQASLARIPDGVGKDRGIEVGEDAAAAIVQLRQGDGRGDPTKILLGGTAPGQWRLTPPGFAPMAAPWYGFVKPLLLNSPTQIPLAGPDPVSSANYAVDFAEVRKLGALVAPERTTQQTQTALFFSDNVIRQYQESFRLLAIDEGLDIVESARMYAMLNMTGADAFIACWRGKFDFAFWRPITAIQTTVDPLWTTLLPDPGTPPYPDYPSGHACLTGATANGLTHLFGSQFDLELRSLAAGAGPNRHYLTEATLNQDTMNARVWLGIHFRKAMVDGNQLGRQVSAWALERYFRSVDCDDRSSRRHQGGDDCRHEGRDDQDDDRDHGDEGRDDQDEGRDDQDEGRDHGDER